MKSPVTQSIKALTVLLAPNLSECLPQGHAYHSDPKSANGAEESDQLALILEAEMFMLKKRESDALAALASGKDMTVVVPRLDDTETQRLEFICEDLPCDELDRMSMLELVHHCVDDEAPFGSVESVQRIFPGVDAMAAMWTPTSMSVEMTRMRIDAITELQEASDGTFRGAALALIQKIEENRHAHSVFLAKRRQDLLASWC